MSVAIAGLLAYGVALVQAPPCREVELRALILAQEEVARGDDDAARVVLDGEPPQCALRRLASLTLQGWREARVLAAGGGAVELQGPVRRILDTLQEVSAGTEWALDGEYAVTTIRAAIAAAQDERAEMELLLTHARDLSERLLLRNRRAQWPRTFNLVAGELWFEVDRYEDALTAYERAVRADASPVALVGLARSLARLDRLEEACAAYRRVSDPAPRLRERATPDLVRCP